MSCADCNNKTTGHFCKAGNREQFQAVLVPETGSIAYESPTGPYQTSPLLSRNAANDCADGRRCTWWWITVHPRNIGRLGVANPAPPPFLVPQLFPPLTDAEIQNNGMECSTLKVKLTLSDSTDKQRTVIVDVGAGFSIPWYGTAVQIEVLTYSVPDPDVAVQLYPIAKVEPGFAGFTAQAVEDVVIEANAVAVDSATRASPSLPLTYTQTIVVLDAPTSIEFPRPAGAVRLNYYQSAEAAFVGFGVLPSIIAAIVTNVGVVTPHPGLSDPSPGSPIAVPGSACSLVAANTPNGNYTVVWEISP